MTSEITRNSDFFAQIMGYKPKERLISSIYLRIFNFEKYEVALYPNHAFTNVGIQFKSDERIKEIQVLSLRGQVLET